MRQIKTTNYPSTVALIAYLKIKVYQLEKDLGIRVINNVSYPLASEFF